MSIVPMKGQDWYSARLGCWKIVGCLRNCRLMHDRIWGIVSCVAQVFLLMVSLGSEVAGESFRKMYHWFNRTTHESWRAIAMKTWGLVPCIATRIFLLICCQSGSEITRSLTQTILQELFRSFNRTMHGRRQATPITSLGRSPCIATRKFLLISLLVRIRSRLTTSFWKVFWWFNRMRHEPWRAIPITYTVRV